MTRWLLILPILCSLLAAGQVAKKDDGKAAAATSLPQLPAPQLAISPAPAAPADDPTLTAYLLTDSQKLELRSLQLEWAEREAANQTMKVTISENTAKQAEIMNTLRYKASAIAAARGIDAKLWTIDEKELKFVKKKVEAAK